MKSQEIDTIAEACHEANRVLQRRNGEVVNFPWENTSELLRESTRSGVRGILEGNTPEQSHENWMRTRVEQGWIYGPVKNFTDKTHPDLVPYAELPSDQQLKDFVFRGVVQGFVDFGARRG